MREPVAPDRTAEPCQNPGPGDPFGVEEQQDEGGATTNRPVSRLTERWLESP
jgi:hypothetical protein